MEAAHNPTIIRRYGALNPMAEADLIRLIESHSTELAALREMFEKHVVETRGGFQTINWKLDRLVEVVDALTSQVGSLNNRELINNQRLTKLEKDVTAIEKNGTAIEKDVGAIQKNVGTIEKDVAAIKAKLGV